LSHHCSGTLKRQRITTSEAENFDDDASWFTASMINSPTAKDVSGHPMTRPDDHRHFKTTNEDAENVQILHLCRPEIAVPADAGGIHHQPSSMAQNDNQTAPITNN